MEDKLRKQHCLESTGPQLHDFQPILTFSELEHWLNYANCLVVTHWCPPSLIPWYETSVLLAAVLVAIAKVAWLVVKSQRLDVINTRCSQGPCGVVIIWLDYSHYM